jgi:hypothetical protein
MPRWYSVSAIRRDVDEDVRRIHWHVYVAFAGMHSFRVAVICWQTYGPEQSAGLLHAFVQTNGPLPIAMQRPPWHSMPASPSPVAVQHDPMGFVPS